jgi:hypothetical protein
MNDARDTCRTVRAALLEQAAGTPLADPDIQDHAARCDACRRYRETLAIAGRLFPERPLYTADVRRRALARLSAAPRRGGRWTDRALVGASGLAAFAISVAGPVALLKWLLGSLVASPVAATLLAIAVFGGLGAVTGVAVLLALTRGSAGCGFARLIAR